MMIRELHNFLLRAGFERAASCLSSIDEKINNLSKVIKNTFVGTSLFQIIWKDDLDRDARALINEKISRVVVSPARSKGLALVRQAEKEGQALVDQAKEEGQALVVQAAINKESLVTQAKKEADALFVQACGVITDRVVQQVAQEVWQTCYSGCLLGDFRKESIQKSIEEYIRADHQPSPAPETRVSSPSSVSDATTDSEDNIPSDDRADAYGDVSDFESFTPPEDTAYSDDESVDSR